MKGFTGLKGLSLILLAGLLVWAWNLPPAAGGTGALDGKSFAGQMGQAGKKKGDQDTFIFKNGKFHSIACDPYGFGDGEYTAAVESDTISFKVTTTSPTDGRMEWNGTVQGRKLEGTATWHRVGKDPVEHWLNGGLKE